MGATSHRRWCTATVVDAAPAADGIRRIVLEPEGGAPPAPPGSHLDVGVYVNGGADVRSYSVVGVGPYGNAYVLGVQLARQSRGGSAYMHALRRGAKIDVTQPLQNFPLSFGRPRYVLLAGGIGITALVAMGTTLRQRGADYRFLYAGRTRSVMAFLDELTAEHGDRLEPVVEDETGRLDVDGLVKDLEPGTELYVCGPIPMLDAVRRAWAEAGRPPSALRFETFGSSGRFAPEPFRVRIPRIGLDVVVSHDVTMLEALEHAGADMMFDCRRGECGLCEIRVLEVQGVIDHRDVFFSDAQHRRGDRMCTCVSRVVSPRTAGVSADDQQPALTIEIP
jgi:vanillate O-demethylase ferredoxin subunit